MMPALTLTLALVVLVLPFDHMAVQEFNKTIQADPTWPMGYWGLAMTCKQQLWMTEDPETAHATLTQMDKQVKGELHGSTGEMYVNKHDQQS